MKLILQTAVALLVASSIVGTSTAVIRSYTNEVNILNVYEQLKDIKGAIKDISNKIDNLRENKNGK